MPIIAGELSPSPPILPSPAPTRKTRSSTSKVNRLLDIHRTASPLPPLVPTQETSMECPVTEAITPQSIPTVQDGDMEQDTSQTTRPSNNRLPLFNQVKEIANLQPQRASRRPEQKDPLDKFSKGITITIHEAYPGSAYARMKQDVLDDWRKVEGETLLAIPFGSDAESAELHNETCDLIFDAVGEITQSKSYGVASPIKKEELQALITTQRRQSTGQKRKQPLEERLPATFLIHSLSKVHYQILMQQTVWASQAITFRITPPEMICPDFLFAIKGLRSNCVKQVEKCVRDTWNDEITTCFFQNGIAKMGEKERAIVSHSVQMFKESMWVEKIEKRVQGGTKKPIFNVYVNGNFINDSSAWSSIRTHLADRTYYDSKFGEGENDAAPEHCGLCHGIDHPRGMCPFPKLDGWMGPDDTNIYHQKTERYPRFSGRFPPGKRY